MTKLLEWLTALVVLATIWLSLLTNKIENSIAKQHPKLLFYSPLIFVVLFGLYAAIVVLYRTFTFNNCEEAAAALLEEIQEAKSSLKDLGYKFPTKTT